MTDLERLKSLLTDFGINHESIERRRRDIGYREVCSGDPEDRITCIETDEGIGLYYHFARFYFGPDGKFLAFGVLV